MAAALQLTLLDRRLEADPAAARAALTLAREQLESGLADLRALARGIHPTVLTDRGLRVALEALVKRALVPVELRVDLEGRLDASIEAAAYFLVSEALTNVAKHARAAGATVDVACSERTLVVTIADDGVGGAELGRGSGLCGLADRVAAVGGRLEVTSPAGRGTRLCARLPTHVLGALNGR